MKYNTIIIGGGTAGLMCAYQLEEANIDYVVLEKNDSLGKKLLLTGGTRCNVTNNLDTSSFISSLTIPHRRFLYSSLSDFNTKDIIKFFNDNGCSLVLNEGFKYFPKSYKSIDVLKVFIEKISKNRIILNSNVTKIAKNNELFVVQSGSQIYQATNVVIATGSKSFPKTGSCGDGLEFAKMLGINYFDFTPAETNVFSRQVVNELADLQGFSFKNINVSIKNTNIKTQGDVLFTHFGLSGPAIMHLSEYIFDYLKEGNVTLKLPLTNSTQEEINSLFIEAREKNFSLLKTLEKLTTKKIAKILIDQLSIEEKNFADLNKRHILSIKEKLLGYDITVDNVLDVTKAYVNKGGIDTKELSPKTMEVKSVTNLYFIGETVDLHGPIGGFNITIAFCTAVSAAKDIIKKNH
ncbi:MAG: aminoacetone oxidase family FAD-binding enzyme [Bacilli bacterium]